MAGECVAETGVIAALFERECAVDQTWVCVCKQAVNRAVCYGVGLWSRRSAKLWQLRWVRRNRPIAAVREGFLISHIDPLNSMKNTVTLTLGVRSQQRIERP